MTDILKSKRFISGLIGILAMLLVAAIPDFQSAETELITAFTSIILFLIGGYTLEGSFKAWLAQPGNIEKAGAVLQYLIDKAEAVSRVDIPDDIEAAAVQEAKEAAQKYAFDEKANEDWLKS
ncbi:MAG: hypothetical protein K8I82_29245 [Anaerolineae bacterium]|nr:hypothetical protein [Anaerolineae bacterium]